MYARIEPKFWNDPLVRKMAEDARTLFFYILTSPQRNMIGLFHLPTAFVCYHLQWTDERYAKAMKELVEKERVKYDEETELILIVNFLKYQPPENSNQIKAAIKKINELPVSSLFLDFTNSIESVYSKRYEILSNELRHRFERVSKGFPNGFERVTRTVSKPVTVTEAETVTGNREQTTVTEDKIARPKRPQKNDEGVVMSKPDTETALSIISEYNEMLGHIKPKLDIEITPVLLCRINRLVSEYKIKKVLHGLKKVVDSDWLVSSNFICLDWIVHPENFFKILSGKYDNKKNKAKTRYEQQMEELNRGIEEEKAKMRGEHSDEQTGNTGTFENNHFDIPTN